MSVGDAVWPVRRLGAVTVTPTSLWLQGVAHHRGQGRPRVTVRRPVVVSPMGVAHARAVSGVEVAVRRPVEPVGLVRVRGVGAIEVSVMLWAPALSRS